MAGGVSIDGYTKDLEVISLTNPIVPNVVLNLMPDIQDVDFVGLEGETPVICGKHQARLSYSG